MDTSVRIAKRWNVPASVIAVTIIAAGTSAPELMTSVMASFRGSSDISVGNVIGSNTFNILAVGGLSLIFLPKGKMNGTQTSWFALIASSGLFYYFISNQELTRIEGLMFLGGLMLFIVLSFLQKREEDITIEEPKAKSFALTFTLFGLSFLGLIVGAELGLTGGVKLGEMAGLSERVIAITIISAGTGLPELATSVAAAFRGRGDIALANVIGSNIFNTLAIPGITATAFTLQVDKRFLSFDFDFMIGATLSVGLLYIIKSPKIRRIFGLIMFLSYSAYVTSLLIQ